MEEISNRKKEIKKQIKNGIRQAYGGRFSGEVGPAPELTDRDFPITQHRDSFLDSFVVTGNWLLYLFNSPRSNPIQLNSIQF